MVVVGPEAKHQFALLDVTPLQDQQLQFSDKFYDSCHFDKGYTILLATKILFIF